MIQTPTFVTRLFPKRIWAFPAAKNTVYLTFDDGPIPEVTPWVLQQLDSYQAKATFFCIGDNVQKHPEVFQNVLDAGHCIGNHTFHHKNGWKTGFESYRNDVALFEETVDAAVQNSTIKKLFRPPYGKMTSKQAKALQKQGYNIIMWSILSKDYDIKISEEQCLQNVLKHMKPGSIVVFHDSLKAFKNLEYALPKVLAHCKEKGWKCAAITL
jgi:peptidoglycan/xylan/chitin deacetylase (PgdA/CDA1 family)